jgi:uncharacterized protein involved in outer membrane biogenesis
MRKLFLSMVLLLVAVGVIAAVAAVNLNSYLNDNKGWIAEQAEAALGRPVAFESVGLSFNRGLAVEVRDFRVGEDERFASAGDETFLMVGRTSVRVALWPALFGRVEVRKISLSDVSITVIQTDTGLSTDSLGAPSEPPATTQSAAKSVVKPIYESQAETKAKSSSAPASESEAGVEAISIAMAEIRSGRLRYIDRTGDSPREIVMDQLEFWTQDLALARPIDFQLVAEVLGTDGANLTIHGQFGPVSSTGDTGFPVDIEFSLDPIDAGALATVPGLADSLDPEHPLSGTLKLSGSVGGTSDAPNLKFAFDATDAVVPYGEDSRKERGAPMRLAADLVLAGNDLEIKALDVEAEGVLLNANGRVVNLADPTVDLSIAVFGGTIEIDGGWSAEGRLALDTKLIGIQLGELTRSLASPSAQVLDGSLNMSLALKGTGTSWDEVKPGLAGKGTVQIDSGILHDINLIEEAIAGITGVPGLSDELPNKIGKKYPKLFSTGDTEFDRMEVKLEVRDGKILIDDIKLSAKEFGLRGKGNVSLDGDLKLLTHLALSSGLSTDLIERASPLKYLRGDDGRIEIPIRITGELPNVSAKPDTDSIAKKLGAGAAEKFAKKSFKKLRKKKRKKKGSSAAK